MQYHHNDPYYTGESFKAKAFNTLEALGLLTLFVGACFLG